MKPIVDYEKCTVTVEIPPLRDGRCSSECPMFVADRIQSQGGYDYELYCALGLADCSGSYEMRPNKPCPRAD